MSSLRLLFVSPALLLVACGSPAVMSDAGGDAAVMSDGGSDAGEPRDAGSDAGAPPDAGTDAAADAGTDAALDAAACSLVGDWVAPPMDGGHGLTFVTTLSLAGDGTAGLSNTLVGCGDVYTYPGTVTWTSTDTTVAFTGAWTCTDATYCGTSVTMGCTTMAWASPCAVSLGADCDTLTLGPCTGGSGALTFARAP